MAPPASNPLPENEIPTPSPLPDAEVLQQMLVAAAEPWRRRESTAESAKSAIPTDQRKQLQRLLKQLDKVETRLGKFKEARERETVSRNLLRRWRRRESDRHLEALVTLLDAALKSHPSQEQPR
jgi:hypothetical protein